MTFIEDTKKEALGISVDYFIYRHRYVRYEATTPRLIEIFTKATEDLEPRTTVDDLLAWAMRQEFEPGRAERIEREAWGEADHE